MSEKTHKLTIRCTEQAYEYMRQKSFDDRIAYGDILEEMIKLLKLKDNIEKTI